MFTIFESIKAPSRDYECLICQETGEDQADKKEWVGHTYEKADPHCFHRSCLTTWFEQKKECPTCRAPSVLSDKKLTVESTFDNPTLIKIAAIALAALIFLLFLFLVL